MFSCNYILIIDLFLHEARLCDNFLAYQSNSKFLCLIYSGYAKDAVNHLIVYQTTVFEELFDMLREFIVAFLSEYKSM